MRCLRAFVPRVRYRERRLLHVPGPGRAALGAQPAVHAEVLVLDHHAPGLLERRGREKRLTGTQPRRLEPLLDLRLRAVRHDREAIDGTNVEARGALDAELRREDGLQVAVETALDLGRDLLGRESELDFDVELLEALLEI